MKKAYTILLLFVLSFGLLAGCSETSAANKDKVVTLRIAHNQSTEHPVHKSLVKFVELVEEKTNGSVTGEIFANGELGEEREALEMTQKGIIDITKVSANTVEGFEPAYTIFSVPYLFKDREHLYKVMNSDIAEDIFQSTKDKGFIGLTWYDAGSRSFYTRNDKPIEKPEDLKGSKIRVQPSDTLIRNVELMGGSATPMPFNEVYTAMQQGVIDGAENNVTAMTDMNLGEVTKHFTFDEHMFTPDILVMNTDKFAALSDDQQQAIKEAAKESTAYHKDLWEETANEAIEQAEEMGVTFHYPDKAPFEAAVKPLQKEYEENPATAAYFKRIKAMGEEK